MPLTTSELFAKVIAQRNWYKSLGIDKSLASKTKEYFAKGTLSEAKQTEILLKLGYTIRTPQLWNSTVVSTIKVEYPTEIITQLVNAIRYTAPRSNALNEAYHKAKEFLDHNSKL